MSHVFRRIASEPATVAISAKGVEIVDSDGRHYLDGCGGALVVNIGHGDEKVVAAMAGQAARLAYVHGTSFTTDAIEAYADELAPFLPLDGPRVYPVSGGSEAVETALKLARAYHLARGEPQRQLVLARAGSYHGNTLGALDVSGRDSARAPYLPWLGRVRHVPAVQEYRCPLATHPDGCGQAHAAELESAIVAAGPERVAAFVAEPVGGATTGAAIPPAGYWPAVADVCRRHGVLLVADEVMTGFGRTGRWFAVDHWGVRPDILVAGKGAASGYWPLGLAVASSAVHDAVAAGGFVHGFTASHHPVGAAVGHAVLKRLIDGRMVDASAAMGERLLNGLREALNGSPIVGDVRGIGLMAAVEIVTDRASARPFPVQARMAARLVAAARSEGLLVYPSTGCAGDGQGDLVMLGPPFTVTAEQIDDIVARISAAVATLEA